MKRYSLLVAVLLALALCGPALAQDDGAGITYGDEFEGEITNAQFEVVYPFTGAAGDIIHAYMVVADSGEFYEPSLILLDAENTLLASVDGWYEATLMAVLPEDGDYTLLASRFGGRTGTGVGNYTLRFDQVINLALSEPVEAEMSNEDTALYAVSADVPFTLEFERLSGDFSPEVTLNTLAEYGELELVGTFYGATFAKTTVVIEPDPDQPVDFYLIRLAQSSWDWNYDLTSSQYRISATQ